MGQANPSPNKSSSPYLKPILSAHDFRVGFAVNSKSPSLSGFHISCKTRERERERGSETVSVYKVRDFDFSSGFDFLKCQVNPKKSFLILLSFLFFLVELIHTITKLPIQQLIFNSEFDVIMNDYEGQNGKRGRACVVVLGDLGRSPRMQYHALSLARQVHLSFFLLFIFLYLKSQFSLI